MDTWQRATVVLDPIFKRVGLSGKSVIPMVIGTGCAIRAYGLPYNP